MTTTKELIKVLNEVRNQKKGKTMSKTKRTQNELIVVAARKLYGKALEAKTLILTKGGNDPVINDIVSRVETLVGDIEQWAGEWKTVDNADESSDDE
jgi:hypothetical protein